MKVSRKKTQNNDIKMGKELKKGKKKLIRKIKSEKKNQTEILK